MEHPPQTPKGDDSPDRVLWAAGHPWPGNLSDHLTPAGLTVVTHRGTAHTLAPSGGRISWLRHGRGQPGWAEFTPSRTGSITPCGFAIVGVKGTEWHATSAAIWIATGTELPDDDLLDELIRTGTGVSNHPREPCDAVYCQAVDDAERAAHLAAVLTRLRTHGGRPPGEIR